MRLRWTCLWSIVALAGCGAEGDTTTADPRFSTPERTVETLFTAYGIEDMSQADVQARLGQRGAFDLRDQAAHDACFADIERPGGQGFAGYVFGQLAARKDELRYTTVAERATVSPRSDISIVMRRGEDGAYRIVLGQSVPENVARGLLQVEENAAHRAP